MSTSLFEEIHDTFSLRIERKQNGKKTTRLILYAQCCCGFRTDRRLVRVKYERGKESEETKLEKKDTSNELLRQYLDHLNGNASLVGP